MDSPEQICSELQQRISQLCNFEGETLKTEMQQLKKALLENPEACLLLHEEDVGTMVAALRKNLGIAIASSAKEKKPSAKKAPKVLTGEDLKKALEESDEEWN
jgi:hypothetical protein